MSSAAAAASAAASVPDQIATLERRAAACDARVAECDAEIRRASARRDAATAEAEQHRRKARTLQLHPESAVASSAGGKGSADWNRVFDEWDGKVAECLASVFGLAAFRKKQRSVINAAMARKDVFVIMPTGGGKSLLYQLPGFLARRGGLTIVVSPLISLITDQVAALNNMKQGCAVALAGKLERSETSAVYKRMMGGDEYRDEAGGGADHPLRFVYVTPEKCVASKMFHSKLEALSKVGRLERIVVDECHCASTWGHDFRPDYKKLGMLKRMCSTVPTMCLTATATPSVVEDVSKILSLESDHVLIRTSCERANLRWSVVPKQGTAKDHLGSVAEYVRARRSGACGIVYCFSKKEADDVARHLNETGIKAGAYHAGVEDWKKAHVQREWMADRINVVVATIAFGLGINKPDVAFVLHFSVSKSLEAYYQEAGRAGRDGSVAECCLMYSPQDICRVASLVAYDQSGIEKLRGVAAYAETSSRCRRAHIASALGENPKEGSCGGRCDCCGTAESGPRLKSTLHAAAGWARGIHRVLASNVSGKGSTLKQLVDEWRRSTKAAADAAESTKGLSKGQAEHVIVQLWLAHALQFDFASTAYATNTYVSADTHAARTILSGANTRYRCELVDVPKPERKKAKAARVGVADGGAAKPRAGATVSGAAVGGAAPAPGTAAGSASPAAAAGAAAAARAAGSGSKRKAAVITLCDSDDDDFA